MTDAPKSALELVMERLRKKDAETGVAEQKLTDEQKAAIAEARSVYEARVAERQILQRSKQSWPPPIRRNARRSTSSIAAISIALPPIVTPRSGRSASRPSNRDASEASDRHVAGVRAVRVPAAGASADDSRQHSTGRSRAIAGPGDVRDAHRSVRPAADRDAGSQTGGGMGRAIDCARSVWRTRPLEPWRFGRGWVLDRLVVEMVEPRYMPLIGYAEAWSPSTPVRSPRTPVMIGGRSTGRRPGDAATACAARSS